MAGILFEDIFDVKDIDPDGKKFDRGETIFSVCVYFYLFSLFCISIIGVFLNYIKLYI